MLLVCYTLSFGAKEQAVSLPFCLILIDWQYNRNFSDATVWLEKAPLLIMTLIFAYITLRSHADNYQGLLSNEEFYPFKYRLALGSYALTDYIVKLTIPLNLSYFYPFPMRIGDPLPILFFSYPIGTTLIIVSFWKAIWRHKTLVFGLLFFLINLSLTLHIFPMSRLWVMADRYVYVASIGWFLTLAWIFRNVFAEKGRITLCILILYALSLGTYAHLRTRVWENDYTLKNNQYPWEQSQ